MENIERTNGFIDLDKYFKDKYKLKNVNIETLDENHIINPENRSSAQLAFWFHDKESIFFKECENIYEAYIELISEEFIKNIGLETAHYDLAIFNNSIGVISYNFEKDNYTYEDLYRIFWNYYHNVIKDNEHLYDLPKFDDVEEAFDVLNNLDDIWYALEHNYQDYPNKQEIVYKLMKDIIKLFIFDLFMNQKDRHCSNYMICTNLNDKYDVSLGPVFDYGNSLFNNNGLDDSIKADINNYNSKAKVSNKEVLITFLNKSSIEYKNMFFEVFETLTPQNFLDAVKRVEERCNGNIPINIKKKICMNFLSNYNEISDIINNYEETNNKKK